MEEVDANRDDTTRGDTSERWITPSATGRSYVSKFGIGPLFPARAVGSMDTGRREIGKLVKAAGAEGSEGRVMMAGVQQGDTRDRMTWLMKGKQGRCIPASTHVSVIYPHLLGDAHVAYHAGETDAAFTPPSSLLSKRALWALGPEEKNREIR